MLIVDDKEVKRKSDFLDCSQFTPKQREVHFAFFSNKPSVLQTKRTLWEVGGGSEILGRGVSRIFKQANKRIYG